MVPEFLPGNRLTLLDSGREYFPALLAALEEAREEIFLESYIYANDATGQAVTAALCRAAARGVRVQVTVDGIGARNFAADFRSTVEAAGVKALFYRPELTRFNFRRHRLRRLHRKLVVIDAAVAFVGGINIISDDNCPPDLRPHYDYAVRIEGPVVGQAHHAASRMWNIVAWASFRRRLRVTQPLQPGGAAVGVQRAAFLIRDNIRHRNDILHAYLEALHGARDEVLIANAYFLPGVRFGKALLEAAQRGVRVTVLVQGKTDHPLIRYATQALYATALAAGIRVFEYERSFLHAKVAVIDGEWATVGSSNIDPFSLLIAKEANVVVQDAGFAGQLAASLRAAMSVGAREIRPAALARLPWYSRLLRWASYGAFKTFMGLTGYGQKHFEGEDARRP